MLNKYRTDSLVRCYSKKHDLKTEYGDKDPCLIAQYNNKRLYTNLSSGASPYDPKLRRKPRKRPAQLFSVYVAASEIGGLVEVVELQLLS